ncbi:uncharacterized protein LOC133833939 [Humulus lupulus]|uniref:uncharacterized protein LOC133833939 n=1 Tax=Humulus lupulus TaxID=3486 RepID=UPI002B40E0F7|nr:uncharacterized protein LOC133833939 [Humulus lupulus]
MKEKTCKTKLAFSFISFTWVFSFFSVFRRRRWLPQSIVTASHYRSSSLTVTAIAPVASAATRGQALLVVEGVWNQLRRERNDNIAVIIDVDTAERLEELFFLPI